MGATVISRKNSCWLFSKRKVSSSFGGSLKTYKMDSARNTNVCRHFMNGSCRFGSRCYYRHEWPVIPTTQICKYYQKGGCWYGACCRFLHVLQPEVGTAVAGRRGSVPGVSSNSVAHSSSDRRGSEPAFLHANVTSRQECIGSQWAENALNPQHTTTTSLPANARDQSQVKTDLEPVQNSEIAQASAYQEIEGGPTESEPQEGGAAASGAAAASGTSTAAAASGTSTAAAASGTSTAAAASGTSTAAAASGTSTAAAAASSRSEEDTEAFLQSKNVVCGICMEKVYEKEDTGHHIFGILPNCNHPFCLQCIATWRKTKDLGPDVVRACPQCRVRSAFYVPNKYWVEGQAKESLVASFKKKSSKKRCCFYDRYGYCHFKTECLYRHVGGPNRITSSFDSDDDEDGLDMLSFFLALTLLGGDDTDDEDFPFYITEDY